MTREPPLVLLVDDDEDDAYMLRKAFASGPFAVGFAHVRSGAELMAHLNAARSGAPAPERAPHLILLDINIPAMDGFQVLRALRDDEDARSIPVIMFTTSSLADDVDRAYAAGASSYFVKPSSLRELKSFIAVFDEYWFANAKLPSNWAGTSRGPVARIERPR